MDKMIMATGTKTIQQETKKNHCSICGQELNGKKIKANSYTVIYCDKCWKLYIKQNRQMEIETTIYRGGRDA